MSGSVNKVILIGNLGRDPEVRRLNSGDPVVSFSLATTESWRDKATGERKDRTEWHNIVIYNENLGKIAEQYLKKGSKVYLEGQLQTREFTDKDSNQRKTTEVVLQRFRGELTLLDSRGRGEAGSDAFASVFEQFEFRAFLADGKAPGDRRRRTHGRGARRRYSVLGRRVRARGDFSPVEREKQAAAVVFAARRNLWRCVEPKHDREKPQTFPERYGRAVRRHGARAVIAEGPVG